MRLIGRDYDLIGQVLKSFEDERKKGNRKEKKKRYSVTRFADEQEYSKNIKEGW